MAVGGGRAHHQVTFAVLSHGVAGFALWQSLVVPVLTTVQHELHTTQSAATWVLTAYLLSASIMTPILGRIGDMIGKERVFVATLVALAAGSLLAAGARQWRSSPSRTSRSGRSTCRTPSWASGSRSSSPRCPRWWSPRCPPRRTASRAG